jgi:hypothetical protein
MLEAPTRRFVIDQDSDGVRVWVRTPDQSRRRKWWRALQAIVVSGAGLASAVVVGYASADAPGMVLALIIGFVAASLAALALGLFQRTPLIELRDGYLRCSRPWFGLAGRTAHWSRRPRLSNSLRAHLSGDGTDPFSLVEREWLIDVAGGGEGRPRSSDGRAHLALEGDARPAHPPGSRWPVLTICLVNRGDAPLSLKDVEDRRGASELECWEGGVRIPVSVRRVDRERRLGPGERRVVQARLWHEGPLSDRLEVRLASAPARAA